MVWQHNYIKQYALFLMFKFLSETKRFDKKSEKNNTSFLVPYDCMVDSFIKAQKINNNNNNNNKASYIDGFEIMGYNIGYLSPELQEIRIQDLQATFKAMDMLPHHHA